MLSFSTPYSNDLLDHVSPCRGLSADLDLFTVYQQLCLACALVSGKQYSTKIQGTETFNETD